MNPRNRYHNLVTGPGAFVLVRRVGPAPPPVGSPGRRLERVRDVQEDGEGSENDQEALCER